MDCRSEFYGSAAAIFEPLHHARRERDRNGVFRSKATTPTEPTAPVGWVNPYTDVAATDWYYDAVGHASTNSLVSGTFSTTFDPDSPMSRAGGVAFGPVLSMEPPDTVVIGQFVEFAVIIVDEAVFTDLVAPGSTS